MNSTAKRNRVESPSARAKTTLESISAFFLEIDTTGVVTYANNSCHMAFGVLEGELFLQRVTQSLDQFIARTQLLAKKNLSMESLFTSSIEIAVTDRDLVARLMIATIDGIYSETDVVGFSIIMIPKPVTSAALESLVLQSLPASIVATDLDGTIRYWNRGSTTLFGYTATDAIGKNVQNLSHRVYLNPSDGNYGVDLII